MAFEVVDRGQPQQASGAADRPSSGPRCLRQLMTALGADRVALVSYDRGADSAQIVATAGTPLLEPGATIATAASTLARNGLAGIDGPIALEGDRRAVDGLAIGTGLRSGRAIPLKAGRRSVGALLFEWREAAAPVVAVDDCLGEHERDLLATVVAPRQQCPRLLIAHQDRLIAEGIASIAERIFDTSADLAHGVDAARTAAASARYDTVLCSDELVPGSNVGELVETLRLAGTGAPIVVLARRYSARTLAAAQTAGASGLVPLMSISDEIVPTLAAVLGGRSAFPACPENLAPDLTDRELEILNAINLGLADKEVAIRLHVSVSTVKSHTRAIYSKLDATSRVHALHRAREAGLL